MKQLFENWRKYISEAVEEEVMHLQDALDVPVEDYLFSNIFGNRYRLISEFTAPDEGPLSELTTILSTHGWEVDFKNFKARKTIRTRKNVEGEMVDVERIEEVKLIKLINNIITQLNTIGDKVKALNKTEDKTKQKKMIMSFDKGFNKFFGQPAANMKPTGGESYPFQSIVSDPDQAPYFLGMVMTWSRRESMLKKSAAKMKKNAEFLAKNREDISKNYERYFNEKYYMVLSRHPIDVFRMSDHEGLQSCHMPPSKKHMTEYDEYNICALAEAHANGMIAYAISEEFFKDAGIEPTQAGIDKYEDDELFADPDRSVDGIRPEARIRVKNLSYRNESEQIGLAVPQGKIYGDKVPGFIEHLYDVTAEAQKEEANKIIELEGDTVDYDKFTRFGGSYEDSGFAAEFSIISFLNGVSGKSLTGLGSVNYDDDLEASLSQELGSSYERIQLMMTEVEEAVAYRSGNLDIDFGFDVEEHGPEDVWIMMTVTMTITIQGKLRQGKTIRNLMGEIEEALEMAEELYYEIPSPRVVQDLAPDGEDVFRIVLEWDGEKAIDLIGVEWIDPYEIEGEIDSALHHGKNLTAIFASSDEMSDGLPAYIEAYAEKEGVFEGENYSVHHLVNLNTEEQGIWEVEELEYEDDLVMGEVLGEAKFSSSGDISIYPDEILKAALGDQFDDENIDPRIIARAIELLNEVKEQGAFGILDATIEFDGEFTKEAIKEEDDITLDIEFRIQREDGSAAMKAAESLVDSAEEEIREQVESYVANKLKNELLAEANTRPQRRVRIKINRK